MGDGETRRVHLEHRWSAGASGSDQERRGRYLAGADAGAVREAAESVLSEPESSLGAGTTPENKLVSRDQFQGYNEDARTQTSPGRLHLCQQ